MDSLPTLRRKILRGFSFLVLLYAVLGVALVVSVMVSSGTTPNMIHRNYDSVSTSIQMRQAWNAITIPTIYQNRSPKDWKEQFESALKFEESNITEPGEKELAVAIRNAWEKQQRENAPPSVAEFSKMDRLFSDLISINEKGMFSIAESNTRLGKTVLYSTVIYFILTLVLSVFLADGLANRLSQPIKQIAEALHRRPGLGKKLRLLKPTSLEMLILSNELTALWERVGQSEKVNVIEIVRQRNQLETVLESVEDALLVVDKSGQITHCNECMLSLVQLSRDEVKEALWNDLPSMGDNYIKLRSLLRQDMPNGQEIELTLGGKNAYFSARHRTMLGVDKTEIATLFLLHNITEKRQRDKFRADFIDLLSHELKTPIQSLGTASELLTGHIAELPETCKPLAETISEDVERIRAVANEFVQVTQSHSKILKLRMETVAMNQVLPEWLKPFQIVAKDRKVKLKFEQEGSPVISARIDRVKFPWVISNLLSNAIRFTPAGSEVMVVLTDRNGSVEIQIKDEGPGITQDDQLKMFEPFYQGSTAAVSGSRGLFGIGLTITKEVVEAHDGRIEYFKRNPVGSEFRVILPFPA